MKNVTIVDVAGRAGVAKSTVSAVLNNKDGVKESTRRRVRRAIEDLQYRPRPRARRRFRPSHGKSLVFVIKEAQNPYYAEVFSGIIEVAREQGYLAFVSTSEGDYETEGAIVDQCMEQETSGLIVAPVLNDERTCPIFSS